MYWHDFLDSLYLDDKRPFDKQVQFYMTVQVFSLVDQWYAYLAFDS